MGSFASTAASQSLETRKELIADGKLLQGDGSLIQVPTPCRFSLSAHSVCLRYVSGR